MIRFVPHYQPALWGGRALADTFGRATPPGPIGESWELVELPEREVHVPPAGGGDAGAGLGALWRAGRLGGSARGPFPFLLKWIDARQALSVQVHPDEAACVAMGRGAPKTEAWYVAAADPGATLLIGHYPGLDAAALRQAAAGHTMKKWLYETRPRLGDIFLLRAGTVHAIGAGLLILEVQQPSDTTYRIYDYGRVGADGKPRQLHLEEAAACVHYAAHGAPQAQRQGVVGPCFALAVLRAGTRVPAAGLRVLVAQAGPVTLRHARGETALAYGDTVVAEPGDGEVDVAGGDVALFSEPASMAALVPGGRFPGPGKSDGIDPQT